MGTKTSEASTQGQWFAQEIAFTHKNYLELKAVYFALHSLCSHCTNMHILILSDNMTTVFYINKQGGSVSHLNHLTKIIWLWCMDRNIFCQLHL